MGRKESNQTNKQNLESYALSKITLEPRQNYIYKNLCKTAIQNRQNKGLIMTNGGFMKVESIAKCPFWTGFTVKMA